MKASESAQSSTLEIKAGSVTVPILKVMGTVTSEFAPALQEKIRKAPDFFRNAPVVLDLSEVASDKAPIDFAELGQLLRDFDLVPIGVRGGTAKQHLAAQSAKLVVLAENKSESGGGVGKPATAQGSRQAATAGSAGGPSKLVDQPVRSGQRIYASGGDLVVLAPISAGAEVMADGHIHIYSTLRGRALAGVQGNLNARIFCNDLQAELVAIGGHYKISESLQDSVRGKPVQIRLRDETLLIEPF